jgi:peptidoglycan biosynthesis protein MviN/MurJ (putative lipid II flippase)
MAPLPKRYAPFVYGIIQAAITTAVATAIATGQSAALGLEFVERWALAWLMAFLTMLPIVIFVAPLIQRAVSALTTADPARHRGPKV